MTGTSPQPLRGQVWWVEIPCAGRKPLLVVSNNIRNRALPSVLTIRITTAPKPEIPSIVPFLAGEPLAGSALCDDILLVPKDRLGAPAGCLSAGTMARVDEGLRAALALD
ncbi:MAG: type II toxin-antitoxin system PemK/MazF family toxin [Acidobacteria bacterium]|nr:type II toxin-antitoxin system PemK/MazF family toxin [Acidobacteriota bacterium]